MIKIELPDKLRKRLGSSLEENISLRDHVRLGVGGNTDYFYRATSTSDLVKAATIAHDLKLDRFIIGDGSNIVPSDAGFPGLVIKNESKNIFFATAGSEVVVDSGVNFNTLINSAASRDLGGLEFMVGETGTVGGAVYGNNGVGAKRVGDFVKSITVLLEQNGELEVASLPGSWMQFGHENSRIKKASNDQFRPVLLTVTFQLTRRRKDEILTLIREQWAKNDLASKGRPVVLQYFKDPEIASCLSASSMLHSVGAKRVRVGDVSVLTTDPNSFINNRRASAVDVRKLADRLRELVYKQYKVSLEERIEYFGVW